MVTISSGALLLLFAFLSADTRMPETLMPEAFQSEKESRTDAQKKINSQLLYELYRKRGEAEAKGVPPGDTRVKVDSEGRVRIDIRGTVTDALLARVKALGGKVTITQAPPSPYPLGVTPVLLTVRDPKGASDQASANVTVIDTTAPATGPVVTSPSSYWPPNHKWFEVRVKYSNKDNCGTAKCALTVTSNEPINGTGDGNTSPDWRVIDANTVLLRAERSGGGSGRIYTITATCTDAAGNVTQESGTVSIARQ